MAREPLSLPERFQLAERLRVGQSARAHHRARRSAKELWALLHKNSLALPLLVEILDPESDLEAGFHRLADRLDALRVEIQDIIDRTEVRLEAERPEWMLAMDACLIEKNRIYKAMRPLEERLFATPPRKGKGKGKATDAEEDAIRAELAVFHRQLDRLAYYARTYDQSARPPGLEVLIEQRRKWRDQKKTPTG